MKKLPAMEQNQRLKTAILTVVEQQLRDRNPPETGHTLARLQDQGFPREKSLELIGYVVGMEVLEVVQDGRKFDRETFIKRLEALPTLPWELEDG
jgi:hypothetical protein